MDLPGAVGIATALGCAPEAAPELLMAVREGLLAAQADDTKKDSDT